MSALIPFYNKTIGADTNSVSARELHTFIQSKADYSNWITRRIKKYGFQENQDFIVFQTKKAGNNATLKEYFITLDMAKELAMVENNEKGREARQYFIRIEKDRSGSSDLHQIIITQNTTIANLQKQLESKPQIENKRNYITTTDATQLLDETKLHAQEQVERLLQNSIHNLKGIFDTCVISNRRKITELQVKK